MATQTLPAKTDALGFLEACGADLTLTVLERSRGCMRSRVSRDGTTE